MALNSPSTPGWQDGAGALRHGAHGVQGETQTRREGLGALSPGIWRMGSSETVLTARLGRAGARQQPSPMRGALLAGSSPSHTFLGCFRALHGSGDWKQDSVIQLTALGPRKDGPAARTNQFAISLPQLLCCSLPQFPH